VADVIVCALYRFVRLDDFADLRQPLLKTLERNGLRGTLLLAREGINGTVAGPRAGIDALLNHLERDARFAGIDIKESLFCTGGIRCEKSTNYLIGQGVEDVYHLKGGILKYLEEVPEADTRWQGECFVFDERVTVNHALEPGSYTQCNACRMPLSEADRASDDYEQGISCPHCVNTRTEADRARFAERERQLALARERGEAHLGDQARAVIEARRARKHPSNSPGETD